MYKQINQMFTIAAMLLVFSILPASAATVSIGNFSVAPGASVVGSLNASGVTNLGTATINLTYNPSIVIVTGVAQGSGNALESPVFNIDNTSGVVQIIADSTTGKNGEVIIAYITFQAVGSGGSTSPLNISIRELADTSFQDIPATASNGSFTITGADSTLPVINSVALNTTTPTTGALILVTVNATDNVGVTSVIANGVSLTQQTSDIWNGTLTAIEGTHSVNVSASDTAGNVAWNNSSIYTATTPDTTPPVINSVTLNTTTPVTGEPILVTVNATDNVAVTGVKANGTELIQNVSVPDIWEGTIVALAGTHSVNVSASDAAGYTVYNETQSYTATFRVDTLAPTFAVNLSINYTTNMANFNITASEILNTIDINVTRDSTVIGVNKTSLDNRTWLGNYSIATDGNYTITITGTDLAGNTGVSTLNSNVTHITTTQNVPITVSFDNTTINITTSSNVTDARITVTSTVNNPTIVPPVNISSGIFLVIDPSEALKVNLTFVNITVKYNETDVLAKGINESTLRIYLLNGSTWEPINPPNGGVNIVANFVFANLTHFCTFGVFGYDDILPVVTDPRASPSLVPADGKTNTTLRVNVTDPSGIKSVTVNLSHIGGIETQMTLVSGTSISGTYAVTVSVPTTVPEGIYNLPVNATDNYNNSNTSVNISLEVFWRPNITAFSIDSSGKLGHTLNASVTIKNDYSVALNNVTIVVSGLHNTTGYPIYGTGGVNLHSGESTTLKVRVYVDARADTDKYTMFADAWLYENYPDVTKTVHSGPEVTSVTS